MKAVYMNKMQYGIGEMNSENALLFDWRICYSHSQNTWSTGM